MTKIKSIGVISLSIIGSAMITAPANAIPFTQSDTTGTNIWNNTAPIFGTDRKINPEILSTARRLSKDLDDAYTACRASAESVTNLPRRFARGSGNPAEVCDSAECQRLNQLIEETQTFLSGLERSQAERLRASGAFQIW